MSELNDSVSSGSSMTDGLLFEFTQKVDSTLLSRIWTSPDIETGQVAWWDMIMPIAYPLAAIFSILMVAGIAYKMMVLKEGIDIMKLFRPIAIALVLSNWWAVTFGLFQLTRPIEYGFQAGYEYMNEQVDSLREERLELAFQIAEQLKKKAAEADIAKQMEDYINGDKSENNPPEGTKEIYIGLHEVSVNYYDDIMNEKQEVMPENEEGEPNPKYNGQNIMWMANLIDAIQGFALWIAEILWAISLMYVFFIRDLYLTVLVIFGPITIVACMLDQWKDKWTEWLGRFVSVSLYGACAYVCIMMSLILVLTALHADIADMKVTLEDEEGLFSYIHFIVNEGLGTLSVYLISLFVGVLAVPIAFEMATYAIPAEGIKLAAEFQQGLYGKSDHYIKKTTEKAVKTAVYIGAAITAQLDKVAAMESVEKAQKALEKDAEKNDKQPGAPDSDADGTTPDKPDGGGSSDTAGSMGYSDRTGKPEEQGRWPKWMTAFFSGKESEADKIRRAARMQVLDKDVDDFLQAKAEGREEQFLKDYGTRFNEGSLEAAVAAVETEAIRCADRLTVEEGIEAQGYHGRPTQDQMQAAHIDVNAYSRAEVQGLGDEFREIRDARLNENRILMEIMTTGRASLYLFEGDSAKRDAFLKKHGLYKAYRMAEKLEKKADGMTRYNPNKLIDIKGHIMDKIDRLTMRDKFYDKVHGARMGAAEEIYFLVGERCRDILMDRGITEAQYGKGYSEALQRRYDIMNGYSFNGSTADEKTFHFHRDGRGLDTMLKEAVADRNIFIRLLMAKVVHDLRRTPWFHRFCDDGKKVGKLKKELEGLEDAVLQGTGTDYIRKRLDEVEDEKKRAVKEMQSRRAGFAPKPVPGVDLHDDDLDALDKPVMNEFEMRSGIWESVQRDNASYKLIYEAIERIERECNLNEWEKIADALEDDDEE